VDFGTIVAALSVMSPDTIADDVSIETVREFIENMGYETGAMFRNVL